MTALRTTRGALVLLLAVPLACGGGQSGTEAGAGSAGSGEMAASPPPDTIRVQEPGLYPEGIEWDGARGRFLLSSLSRGTVTAVSDDGSHSTLVDDSAGLSSVGLQVSGDRLLVATSDVRAAFDSTAQGRALLGIYDLASGRRLRLVDLGALFPSGRHFANDVAVDADGNAYITDSLSPVIYRVTPDGQASIFVQDTALGGHGFGLNGIDFDPAGFLLVAMDAERALLRIPLADPGSLTRVRLDEPFAADGMVLRPDGHLVAVAATFPAGGGRHEELLEVASDDGWSSAHIVARAPLDAGVSPTTVAVRDGDACVIQAHLSGMSAEQPVPAFEIVRVPLPPADQGT
jgi:sugar lactone lactonase YvrE